MFKNLREHTMKTLLNSAILVTLLAAITQNAHASQAIAPDAASTSLLMGMSCAGLIAVRRFIKR